MPKVTYCGQTFELEKGQTILDAALFAGVDMPYSCQVGSCGTCKCKLEAGTIRPLVDFDYVLLPEEIEQGMILACQSTSKGEEPVCVSPAEDI